MSESGPTLPMATGPMSEAGTLRHFTVTQPFGRFPGKRTCTGRQGRLNLSRMTLAANRWADFVGANGNRR